MIKNLKLETRLPARQVKNSRIKKSFFIRAFGCQYNEWNAARLNFVLQSFGMIESDEKNADVIFIIMCSVRKSAVDRVYGQVRNLENRKVILSGCLLENDRAKFIKKGVTIWDGEDFIELSKILKINSPLSTNPYPLTTNLVPIMKGCNNFCTYCAVPYTRGREISRPMDEILKEVRDIVAKGYEEIILLGQNVNSYKDSMSSRATANPPLGGLSEARDPNTPGTKPKSDFTILLEKINEIEGNFRVKFTSNHPKDMTDDIIEAIATLPKIVKEIHLPLQSGSDRVLKSMNRPYTSEQYLDLVKKIKKRIPEIRISTDVIVGFPTENEEDFQKTTEIIKSVNYFQVYINKYSPREGTAAWKLEDPIPWSEKQRRWRILNEIIKH